VLDSYSAIIRVNINEFTRGDNFLSSVIYRISPSAIAATCRETFILLHVSFF